tara:strand:- start:141 stop:704 length:564 start_codon:yes stop_codon:yes gene_type:complete
MVDMTFDNVVIKEVQELNTSALPITLDVDSNLVELGPDLVINGDFATDSDWTKSSTSATISGGSARIISVANENCFIRQTGYSSSLGKLCEITVTITARTPGGGILVSFGQSGTYVIFPKEVGTHTVQLANNGNGTLTIARASASDTTFDNLSVKVVEELNTSALPNLLDAGVNFLIPLNASGSPDF